MREWEKIIPEIDRQVYSKARYGKKQTFRHNPALVIVDVVTSFTGTKPQKTLEAIDEFRTSCGEQGWKALPHIRTLIDACRDALIPIIYTTGDPEYKVMCGGSTKSHLGATEKEIRTIYSEGFPELITPQEGDFVLRKTKASAFFATPLPIYLNNRGVDSLIICGTTTCGCVRATVVDSFSYGYPTFVVEECCFDRSNFSHLVNLFEMNQKYADVITLTEALELIAKLRPKAAARRAAS
ncbi:MAG: isochorismatase family protein [Deltaproteobacteria bacterium]|nr:isochorismatase family protein [Deltaproteobacteria bacterium]